MFNKNAGTRVIPMEKQQLDSLKEQHETLTSINTNLVSQTEATNKTNELLESLIGLVQTQSEQLKALELKQHELNKTLGNLSGASQSSGYSYDYSNSAEEQPLALHDETGENRPKSAIEKLKAIPKKQRNEELEERLAARGITLDIFKSLRKEDKLKLLEVMFRN